MTQIFDIWCYIASVINDDKDKCQLMMTCKDISKCAFYFNQEIDIDKIINSQWFNKFTNVLIHDNVRILPYSITHLSFDDVFNKSIIMRFPPTITHLTFGRYFSKSIEYCMPSSVIEITFGDNFYGSLIGIPSSVKTINFNLYNTFCGRDIKHISPFIKTINFIDKTSNDNYFNCVCGYVNDSYMINKLVDIHYNFCAEPFFN